MFPECPECSRGSSVGELEAPERAWMNNSCFFFNCHLISTQIKFFFSFPTLLLSFKEVREAAPLGRVPKFCGPSQNEKCPLDIFLTNFEFTFSVLWFLRGFDPVSMSVHCPWERAQLTSAQFPLGSTSWLQALQATHLQILPVCLAPVSCRRRSTTHTWLSSTWMRCCSRGPAPTARVQKSPRHRRSYSVCSRNPTHTESTFW